MKSLWADKTGLAKAAAILSTVLLVALGLCGANFFAVIRFAPLGGPGPRRGHPEPFQWLGNVLGATAYLEAAAIVCSLIGLALVGLIGIFQGWGPRIMRLFGRDDMSNGE